MSYRTKKAVLSSISKGQIKKGDVEQVYYCAYLGTNPVTKKRVRIVRAEENELRHAVNDFYNRLGIGGDFAVMLTPYQAADAKMAYDLLEKNHLQYTLAECVRRLLEGSVSASIVSDVTLRKAYEEYLKTIPTGVHRDSVLNRIGTWVETYGGSHMLSDITSPEMAAYLAKRCPNSPKTYNNHLNYIKCFLNWCAKSSQGYLSRNPIADMKGKFIPYKEPEYMKVADVEKMFRKLESDPTYNTLFPDTLAYAILWFFCGVRREETLRIASMEDAARICLEDETIRISKPKGWTKGIAPRAFHIMPNALAWMRSFDFLAAVKEINTKTSERLVEAARKAGVTMTTNGGRHTFITMHVAAFGNPGQTEAMAGTSKKMRVTNYSGLASKAEGTAYFNIMPTKTNTVVSTVTCE